MATHHAGTVVAAWYLPQAPPVLKVSLAERAKNTLGFVKLEQPDAGMVTRGEMLARIGVMMAGKVADRIFSGRDSTLAEEQLQEIRELAGELIAKLGMDSQLPMLSIDFD
jgi:ATP-dependent Zn protease